MQNWKETEALALPENAFQMIGKDWMLITAKKPDGTVNTMTASWGGMGVLWGRQVAFAFIRPQRYTKEFVEASDHLSLTFFPEEYRKQLAYLGRVSGRDEDKIAKSGLTLADVDGVPVFAEAKTALVCRKLYAQDLDPKCFADPAVDAEIYPTHDYHTVYVLEIEKALVK